ncbi:hypothetical protein COCOR_01804 [Corallococcus coralloides DSM 2259]|uniref:Uncharacterized protein n=1 Tax=Corallococcus coralloides (strain ATCC 25202 / DSM 2259 / NBRC 100086 / M2) TaxID=1144275 RepID=H8N1J6_CORCM|nr:hypothetical protein [Corallococcus coralloides]AFE04299.1 hypothetical protein COCOR_01804 [Corallococcus coralloides DSM 2259]
MALGMGGCQDTPAPAPDDTRMQKLRACVLADLPPPEQAGGDWTVSAYVFVEAYQRCQQASGAASGTDDFRALGRDLARPLTEDPSRVRITAEPPGGAP